MDSKDERYDPPYVNIDSDPELNNLRDPTSPIMSPLEKKDISSWDGFTLNNTQSDSFGYRHGGPLADNDPTLSKSDRAAGGGRKQKIGKCISCETENVKLWHGNRYRCHKGEKIKEHASFCKECATGYDEDDDPMQCPRHSENPLPQSEAEMIPLEAVCT